MSMQRRRVGAETEDGARRLTRAGFAAEFEASSRTLWCIAVGVLGNREEANDVLQEAAMIAMGKLAQFDADTSFTAWMGRIVRNVALNHARHERRRTPAVDHHVLEAHAGDGVRHQTAPVSGDGKLAVDQGVFDDRVVAALNHLDETARACLLLRTLLDMPYREISLALDIPEGTTMSHVHRARRQLRDTLDSSPRTPVPSAEGIAR